MNDREGVVRIGYDGSRVGVVAVMGGRGGHSRRRYDQGQSDQHDGSPHSGAVGGGRMQSLPVHAPRIAWT